MNDARKMLSNSFILFVGTVVSSFFSYLFNMLMGRMLGPSSYGDMVTIMSVSTIVLVAAGAIVTVMMLYSSELYASNNIEALAKLLRVFSKYLLFLSVILFFAISAVSPQIARFFSISNNLLVVLGFSAVIIGFLISVNRGFLQGVQAFVPLTLINVLEMSARLVLGLLAVRIGFGVGGAVLATVVATILAYIATFKPINKILKHRNERETNFKFDKREILAFAVPTFFASLLISVSLNIDVLLVKHYFGPVEAGTYAAISTIGKIILYLLAPIIGVMFPMISEKRVKGEKHYKTLLLAMFLTSAAAIIILTIYTVAPVFVIKVLYGLKYTQFYYLLPQVGLFISIYTLVNLLCNYFIALKDFTFIGFYLFVILLQIIAVSQFHSTISIVVKEFVLSNSLLFLLLSAYYLFTKRSQIVSLVRKEYEQ